MITISSQRHLDDATVEAKRAAKDYNVTVSPVFEIDGDQMRVIIDGHHSYAAAIADGVDPIYTEATEQDDDRVAILNRGDIDGYLEASWLDSDYYDAETGRDIF